MSSGVTGLDPEIMGLGPIEASRQALARAGMTIDDVDLVEINEAFAAQVLPSARALGIDMDKLNVNGGAIALGHPFGQTGARIMTTLLNGLEDADKTIGLETMCVGGGQGMAMIVERLDLASRPTERRGRCGSGGADVVDGSGGDALDVTVRPHDEHAAGAFRHLVDAGDGRTVGAFDASGCGRGRGGGVRPSRSATRRRGRGAVGGRCWTFSASNAARELRRRARRRRTRGSRRA